MNIKIITHFMPWEIDYALLMFEKLKRSSYFLSTNDTIHISAALNLTDYVIDWNESKLPKEYFIKKFKTFSNLLTWSKYQPFIYEGKELWGHLDYHKTQYQDNIDYYILASPDMYFHDHLLLYIIEAAKQVSQQSKNFIITPQIHKMWDSTWDHLTHPLFKNIEYKDWDKGDVYDISHIMNTQDNTPELISTNNFKWAGWFDLYSKNFFEKFLPIPNEWSGYGPWDFYGMLCCDLAAKDGFNIKQFILKNQIIFEHCTGLLKNNNYSSYYKDLLVKKDIPNQRKNIETRFQEDITKWYENFKKDII